MACIEEIKKAAKGIMTPDEVDSLIKALEKIRRKKKGEPGDINSEMLKEAEQMIETWVMAAKIEKRNAGFNIIAEARAFEMMDDYKARNDTKNDADAYINFLVGVERGQGGNSISARKFANEKGVMGGIISEITKADLWDILNKRTLDREIAREMWEIGKPDGQPGISKSKEAKQLADIFHNAQKAVVQMQNDSGAWIGNLPGYIVAQSHNSYKIRNKKLAGKNGEIWVDKIREKIDWEVTAKGLPESKRIDFLFEVYSNLASGEHHVTKGGENSPKDFAFKGSSNLAKNVSSERVLHFKTADDWFDYDAEFGSGQLSESVFSGIERGARNSALMEGLGTNPGHMAEKIKQKLIDRNKRDLEVVDKLKGRKAADTVSWYIDEITGENMKPGSVGWSVFGSIVKAIESTGMLGGAVLSSVNDMATKASQAKFNGISYLEGFGNGLDSLVKGRGNKEMRELADILGVGFDGMMGQVTHRFGGNDSYKGMMNSLVQMTFKRTGLNWWTDAHKTGFSTMLSRNLAIHRGKKWGDLNEELRNSLSLYLKPEEWDIIRTAQTKSVEGLDYITPQAAKNLSDAQIQGIIGEAGPLKIRRYRNNLENSIRNYFVDQAESAIPTPGGRESAIMKGGTTPGSFTGVMRGFFMQFKAFPITFMTKQMGKEISNGKWNIKGMASLIAMSTAMGYLAMTLKDIAKNRTPRDITENPVKVFLAAMQQGGGLGIYGDFLFGEGSRFGRSALGTMLGPAFGSANEFRELVFGAFGEAGEFATGEDVEFKTPNKLFRFVRHHAPIVNWWWTKKAFDGMILNSIQEHINPGYLERTRNFSKKHSDQDFLFGAF